MWYVKRVKFPSHVKLSIIIVVVQHIVSDVRLKFCHSSRVFPFGDV